MASSLRFKNFTPFTASGGAKLLERAADLPQNRGRVYRGVTIIESGLGNRKDRNYYPVSTLKEGVKAGLFEGMTAYVDHPSSIEEETLPERSVRDRAGIYTKVRFRESGGKARVVGDLRVHGHQKWLSDMIDELIEVGRADKIGISINGRGKTVPRKMKLEESGEETEVNYLESFVELRSADIVTEAGAGGGFQQLLESARSAQQEKGMKLTKKQISDLQEAAAKGNKEAIEKLAKLAMATVEDEEELEESSEEGRGTKKKKPLKKKAKKAKSADEDLEESEEDSDESSEEEDDLEESEDDSEESDPDEELDRAIEEAKGDDGSEDDEESDEDDLEDDEDEEDLEESEEDLDDEDLEDDEEDLEESENDDEDGKKRKKLLKSVKKLKAHNSKTREARGGNLSAQIKGKGGKKSGTALKRADQRSRQKGRGFPSSAGKTRESNSLTERLYSKVARLREKNLHLSAELRVRQTADRARKLLRESEIPEDFRPEVVSLLVGKNDKEARKIIQHYEKLFDVAAGHTIREATGGRERDYDEIEGAGSRIREGNYSGDESDEDSLFEDLGLPMKKDKD